jgi:hypothetical protein
MHHGSKEAQDGEEGKEGREEEALSRSIPLPPFRNFFRTPLARSFRV